jgi:hypothetical protein
VPIALAKGKIDDKGAKELREVLGEPIFEK